jgi:hypothetical protein
MLTSIVQDALNGRPIDWQQASQAATSGQIGAALGSDAGRNWSDGLPPVAKGELGEVLGDARSTINGMRRDWTGKTKDPLPGRSYWVPDGRSGPIRFEDKFGYGATLSDRQILAQSHLGDDFVLYHHTPDDVARLFAVPGSSIGSKLSAPDQRVPTYPEVWDAPRSLLSTRPD